MGVDYTFYSVVGFHFTEYEWRDAWERLGIGEDDDETYFGEWEYTADLDPLLTLGTMGSHYGDSYDNTHFVGVRRLTKAMDLYSAPGGVFETTPAEGDNVPTDAERKALRKLGKRILGYKPEVVSFSGMLIH